MFVRRALVHAIERSLEVVRAGHLSNVSSEAKL
jgi:hypothetical protein